jgi:hypothetical protein
MHHYSQARHFLCRDNKRALEFLYEIPFSHKNCKLVVEVQNIDVTHNQTDGDGIKVGHQISQS